MSDSAASRRRDPVGTSADEGFTLIELLVVLLIIGILLAVAIPTYLSITNGANDTAAQSDLQTALTGAKTYYMENNQTYSNISLGPIDTGLSVVTGTKVSSGPHVVSVDKKNGAVLVLAVMARGSTNCWGIVDLTAATTTVLAYTGPGTLFFEEPGVGGVLSTTCSANNFDVAALPSGVKTSLTGFPH